MSTGTGHAPRGPLVVPFPTPGVHVRLAYRELHTAANGTADQVKALGPLGELPRPWDPDTCREPQLRDEVWSWFDEVVMWLNHEYSWDIAGLIPSCWPSHPHLVHEIAVVADQRRRAGLALTSDPLEEWHRYCLPSFIDRLRGRIRDHCSDGHQAWPARGRDLRHRSRGESDHRGEVFNGDLAVLRYAPGRSTRPHGGHVYDIDTGEILEDPDQR